MFYMEQGFKCPSYPIPSNCLQPMLRYVAVENQEGKRDTQTWVMFSFTSNVMIPKSKSMLSTDLQNYLHGSKLIQIHT